MSFATGSGRVAIVTDQRLKKDDAFDTHEPERAPHVLDTYKPGVGIARYALFDYRAESIGAKDRARAREDMLAWLRVNDVRVALVLPTASTDDDNEAQDAETVCWPAFRAPDSLDNMRGTFFEWEEGRYVMPLFPRSPWLKELQQWQQRMWIKRAKGVARGELHLETCPVKCVTPDARMYAALSNMHGKPLAIDIESIEESGTVTAIGVSDGYYACAIPWEGYRAYGHEGLERALGEYTLGHDIDLKLRDLLSADTVKIFHNWTFDVPRLREKGLELNGPIHDTMAAHAIAYPELRHGLQHACASVLNIRPWKSVYHPKLPGVTRDDIEYWIADPVALLDYNADDVFHTHRLASVVLPQVEQEVFKCAPHKRFAGL